MYLKSKLFLTSIIFVVLSFLISFKSYGDMGDAYTCITEKVSQIDSSNIIITDFKEISFSLKMEKLKKKIKQKSLCLILKMSTYLQRSIFYQHQKTALF